MNLNVFTAEDAESAATKVVSSEQHAKSLARRGTQNAAKAPQVTEDDLYARLLKYIPAPLIGLYLMAVNAIAGATSGNLERGLSWATLAVFAIAVPVYLRKRGVVRRAQFIISLAAFAAWAAASPGPFQLLSGWNELYGTLALIGAVLVLIVLQIKPLPPDVINETVSG